MTWVRVKWPGCSRACLMYGIKFVTRVTQVRDTCDSCEGLRYSSTSSSMRGSKFVENAWPVRIKFVAQVRDKYRSSSCQMCLKYRNVHKSYCTTKRSNYQYACRNSMSENKKTARKEENCVLCVCVLVRVCVWVGAGMCCLTSRRQRGVPLIYFQHWIVGLQCFKEAHAHGDFFWHCWVRVVALGRRTFTNGYLHICAYVYVCVLFVYYIYVYTCVNFHKHMYIYVYMCLNIRIYVYIQTPGNNFLCPPTEVLPVQGRGRHVHKLSLWCLITFWGFEIQDISMLKQNFTNNVNLKCCVCISSSSGIWWLPNDQCLPKKVVP